MKQSDEPLVAQETADSGDQQEEDQDAEDDKKEHIYDRFGKKIAKWMQTSNIGMQNKLMLKIIDYFRDFFYLWQVKCFTKPPDLCKYWDKPADTAEQLWKGSDEKVAIEV